MKLGCDMLSSRDGRMNFGKCINARYELEKSIIGSEYKVLTHSAYLIVISMVKSSISALATRIELRSHDVTCQEQS